MATENNDILYEQDIRPTTDRIDKDAGIIRGVRVLGIDSKHGYSYDIEGQRRACPMFEQMAVGLDHDYKGGPMQVADAWGVLTNPGVDEKGTYADLKYIIKHEQTPAIIDDLERGLGLFSLSSVNRVLREQGKVVLDFRPTRVDLVVRGATTRTLLEQSPMDDSAADDALESQILAILRTEGLSASDLKEKCGIAIDAHYKINAVAEAAEAAVAAVEAAVAEAQVEAAEAAVEAVASEQALTVAADARYEQLLAEVVEMKKQIERHAEIAVRYEQELQAKAGLQAEIKEATAGFDLKKFWND